MRELLIVVADFYLPSAAESSSAKAFTAMTETLEGISNVARYGTSSSIAVDWRPWVAQWLGQPDLTQAAPASIAAVMLDEPLTHEYGTQWLAEPTHLVTGLRSVHLDYAGMLRVDASTQVQLMRSFEKDFADAPYRLAALPSGRFLIMGPQTPALRTVDPVRYLGSSIDGAAPNGEGAAGLKRLAAEIEMWLHEHPINLSRTRNRQQPISTLWLWGGGAPLGAQVAPASVQPAKQWLFGDDPYVDGLARLAGAAKGSAEQLSDVVKTISDRVAIVVDAFRLPDKSSVSSPIEALQTIDRKWIAPAFTATVRGDVERLTILANDRCLTLSSRDRFKFWRRRRSVLSALQ